MLGAFKQLDRILRGDATRASALRDGHIGIPVAGLSVVVVGLAIVAGLCLGSFAVIRSAWSDDGVSGDAIQQLFASAAKMPLLFALTLVVTFPSLYVFNALVGSRLTMRSVARLLVAMLGVMMAVLASLGPIIVFFGLSTESYPFMKLLNVVMATVAGFLGLAFLLRTLQRLAMMQDLKENPAPAAVPAPAPISAETTAEADRVTKSALEYVDSSTGRKATAVFRIWMVVFALVGAQMSWVLRPFIGSPELPFAWFRRRESNFFQDVFRALADLFGA